MLILKNKISLLITSIIVLIIAIFIIINTFNKETKIKKITVNEIDKKSNITYKEKIDNFYMQGFNSDNKLSYNLRGEVFYSYDKAPSLIVKPRMTTNNKEGWNIKASKAYVYADNKIQALGSIKITKDYYNQLIRTSKLWIDTNKEIVSTDKKIVFTSNLGWVKANAMIMHTKENKIKLFNGVEGHYEFK